jgi:hypothetical protein
MVKAGNEAKKAEAWLLSSGSGDRPRDNYFPKRPVLDGNFPHAALY